MADDLDIPPLEDMTEVLQKAELIREQRVGSGIQTQAKDSKQIDDAKKRAKVTKNKAQPTITSDAKVALKTENEWSNGNNTKVEQICNKPNKVIKQNATADPIMFGGMKKGFLFDAPKKSTTNKSSSNKAKEAGKSEGAKNSDDELKHPTAQKDQMPYISPGKTESSLNFDEVQQAMSEAKGLLDDQTWITDDFLDKIEKNDTLLKQFSDPKFMSALQEFQTNPQEAMVKHKGNKEVEKFLMDFCGLMGDHFTKLGDSKENTSQSKQEQSQNSTLESKPPKESITPKIVEIDDDGSEHSGNITKSTQFSILKNNSPNVCDKLNTVPRTKDNSEPSIQIHDKQNKADIQEIPKTQVEDEAVKEVLNDPKVMEHLMDSQVMNLIKVLREDPAKGQRIIDKADSDLKSKIQFLVSKGLLQFQRT